MCSYNGIYYSYVIFCIYESKYYAKFIIIKFSTIYDLSYN